MKHSLELMSDVSIQDGIRRADTPIHCVLKRRKLLFYTDSHMQLGQF